MSGENLFPPRHEPGDALINVRRQFNVRVLVLHGACMLSLVGQFDSGDLSCGAEKTFSDRIAQCTSQCHQAYLHILVLLGLSQPDSFAGV